MIRYASRNFNDIRTDLVNYVRQYYPSTFIDFNDSSVGMMLLELNAAVGDMLSHNTDRMFQETQIDFAQQRSSVLSLARTYGLKVPGKRPSVTIVDFSVKVPVFGDTFDVRYAPIITRGSQVIGAGKVFETREDIDFSSPFTIGGIPNRIIIPNRDTNGNIVNYTLTKREIVYNGFSRIFKRVITTSDVRPFLEVILPDNDVLSIDSVITLQGTNYIDNPSNDDFYNEDYRWYEVDALAEDTIFIPDYTRVSDNSGIVPGKYVRVNKRFITEQTDLGFTKLIFGGGTQDISSICDFGIEKPLVNKLGDIINNLSLGITHTPNTTLFIRYRVGGGTTTNLGPNVINGLGIVNFNINGPDNNINVAVQRSLTVNNPIPALGGKNEPSVEEIRNLIRYNFASQNRAVTIKDYVARVALMPGEFGVPFRVGVTEEQNKIRIYTLGLNQSGNLSNLNTTTLNENIATYLSNYRMINDYVEILSGRIINLGLDIDLFIDKRFSQSEIISQVINSVIDYMNINNFDMGENIYMSNLVEIINNVNGVLNITDLRVYNKVGNGVYSLNEISQPYLDVSTRQIDLTEDYALFGEPNSMFEILNPSVDIRVRVK